MHALTPASADDLPPLGELIADEPFWRHPTGTPTGEDNPRHAGLQAWITAYGHQIVNLAANDAGWYHDQDI